MRSAIKSSLPSFSRAKTPTQPRLMRELPAPASTPAPTPVLTQQAPAGEAPAMAEPEQESLEKGWLRITSMTAEQWLDADEGQRRFRLQAASTLFGDGEGKLSTPQREELLQRVDAACAAETGRPQPVYRGMPIDEASATAPAATQTQAQPQAQPQAQEAGLAAPAGVADTQPQSGTPPETKSNNGLMLLAGAVIVGGIAYVAWSKGRARKNPSGKKGKAKKSWWQKLWDSAPNNRKKAKKSSKRRSRK